MNIERPFWSHRYSLYFLALIIILLLSRYLTTGSIMRQRVWGPSLFNPNSPHYSSDDFYPTGLLTVEIAEQFLADTSSGNLSQYTSIEDAAAEALAKHKGSLPSLNRLIELSETASEALAKHEGDIYFNHDQLPPSACKILKDAGH